jgi:putative transposase
MKRMTFVETLEKKEKQYGRENVIYIDETGFRRFAYRAHAWAKRGRVVLGEVSGNNRKCTNLILARAGSRHFAPMLFEGTCDRKIFNTWVHRVLVKALVKPSLIVLDNASFHVRSAIEKILKVFGHETLFLPPYSPDLNPIEHSFAILKKYRNAAPPDTPLYDLVKMFINKV